jgi:hypothetical protein
MTEDPKYVGMKPPQSPDAVVQKYKQGLKERAAAAGKKSRGEVTIPNIASAEKAYNPSKDRPMTLANIGQAQQNMAKVTDGKAKGTLSTETLAGLRELKEITDKERAKMEPVAQETEKTDPKPEMAPEPEKEKPTPAAQTDALASMDDLELELMMSRIRSDVINNDKERKAVEARLKDIDLSEGLATGEFTQLVPVVPGKLEIMYRTVSQVENDNFRRILFNWNAEDARAQTLAGERYGLMQTIAAVVRINGNEMPKHFDLSNKQFDEKTFLSKFELVSSYPTPLIHCLGVHAFWFDQRVRKLFTADALKNG